MLKRKAAIFIVGAVTVVVLALSLYIKNDTIQKGLERDEGIKYLIGVSQPNLVDSWRIALVDEINDEASKYWDLKVIFNDAAEDINKQKHDIENMIEQGIDLLIITPVNSQLIFETISKIYNRGIPVIILENPVSHEDYSMMIYCNNKTIGRLAADYTAKLLGEKGGVVMEILGEPESSLTIDRKIGFREQLKKYPRINLYYVVVGYWKRDETEVRVDDIYKKEPKVDVVFAHNDDMALGAQRIAFNYKINNMKFIGVGGFENGLDAVENGALDGTFTYPTGGKEAIKYALDILNGKNVPKQVELDTCKITRENIGQFK